MTIQSLKNAATFLLTAMALVPSLYPVRSAGQSENTPTTVVEIAKTPRGVVYKVDSRPTGSTPTTDILYAFNQVQHERGSNAPVVVLIDPRVPINRIWDIDGTAAKAQLSNLRYFVLIPDTKNMAEIKWGPVIPVSTHPPAD
jgi:hypothetical protein